MPHLVVSALLAVAAAAAGAAAQFSSNETACTHTYTVVAGDTCDSIGQKTWTPTFQLMSNNLILSGPLCYSLPIGARLCLGRYGNDCQFVHRVRGDDTCDSIASQYGISRELLINNNPMIECDNLYDGFVACVAAGQVRPPPQPELNKNNVPTNGLDASFKLASNPADSGSMAVSDALAASTSQERLAAATATRMPEQSSQSLPGGAQQTDAPPPPPQNGGDDNNNGDDSGSSSHSSRTRKNSNATPTSSSSTKESKPTTSSSTSESSSSSTSSTSTTSADDSSQSSLPGQDSGSSSDPPPPKSGDGENGSNAPGTEQSGLQDLPIVGGSSSETSDPKEGSSDSSQSGTTDSTDKSGSGTSGTDGQSGTTGQEQTGSGGTSLV